MDFALPGAIALVILLGLVAFFIGHKGWNWGTVTAAALLVLASGGYIFLASRLAERERAWRSAIAKAQQEIDRIVGAGGPGEEDAPNSLAWLELQRERWTRALAFVDTWRARTWRNAALFPPRAKAGGKPGEFTPGTITLEAAGGANEKKPVEVGAEVAVFDDQDIADGGRFLGLFRVTAASAAPEEEKCTLSIVPASSPVPPTPAEAALWTQDYEAVTVYESLPVDRWLAFHRTSDVGPGGDAHRWRPQPAKPAEETLVGLERQMEDLERHQSEVPEADWADVKAAIDAGEIPPGRYWATVTFTQGLMFTRKGKFALDDGTAAASGGGTTTEAEEEEGDAGGDEAGGGTAGDVRMITDEPKPKAGEDDAPPGSEPTAGAVTRRFLREPARYEAGDTGELDLQTAIDLRNREWARIDRVVERRSLADPLIAIRGGRFELPAADGNPISVQALGSDALRRALMLETESIATATDRVLISQKNVDQQVTATAEQTKKLQSDLESWGKDVAAATALVRAFDDRLKNATRQLAAAEDAIVRLGRELGRDFSRLTEAVDAVAPAPR